MLTTATKDIIVVNRKIARLSLKIYDKQQTSFIITIFFLFLFGFFEFRDRELWCIIYLIAIFSDQKSKIKISTDCHHHHHHRWCLTGWWKKKLHKLRSEIIRFGFCGFRHETKQDPIRILNSNKIETGKRQFSFQFSFFFWFTPTTTNRELRIEW